jgi:hypothetical protein
VESICKSQFMIFKTIKVGEVTKVMIIAREGIQGLVAF